MCAFLDCSFYVILQSQLDYRWFTAVFNRQQLGLNARMYFCILLKEFCVLKIKMKHFCFILLEYVKKKVLKLGIRWMKFGKRICVIIFSLNGIVEGEKLHVYLIKHFKKDFCSKKYVYWSFFQVDGNMANINLKRVSDPVLYPCVYNKKYLPKKGGKNQEFCLVGQRNSRGLPALIPKLNIDCCCC